MINLYQILNLSPQANTQEIQAALQHAQTQQKIDEKTASAVRSWLLEPDVRMRYDARLKMEQPEFFQAAAHRQTLKVKTSHNAPSQTNPVFKIKNHSSPAPASVKQQWIDENGDQIIEYTPILWNPKVIAIWAFFSTQFLVPTCKHSIGENWREKIKPKKHGDDVGLIGIFHHRASHWLGGWLSLATLHHTIVVGRLVFQHRPPTNRLCARASGRWLSTLGLVQTRWFGDCRVYRLCNRHHHDGLFSTNCRRVAP